MQKNISRKFLVAPHFRTIFGFFGLDIDEKISYYHITQNKEVS